LSSVEHLEKENTKLYFQSLKYGVISSLVPRIQKLPILSLKLLILSHVLYFSIKLMTPLQKLIMWQTSRKATFAPNKNFLGQNWDYVKYKDQIRI
jgi:hypothetical protein